MKELSSWSCEHVAAKLWLVLQRITTNVLFAVLNL